jgi:hypothetical protein
LIVAKPAVGSDPQAAVAAGHQALNETRRKTVRVMARIGGEMDAVESRQTFLGSEPEIAVRGLRHGLDGVLRQAGLAGPGSLHVLRDGLGRVEGERTLRGHNRHREN